MASSFAPGPPEREVGLGTAYERLAISRRVDAWFPTPPTTALEGPIDGMAGLPGLHLLPLAQRGTHVTVALPDAAALARVERIYQRAGLSDRLTLREAVPDQHFDLVFSFNALPLAPSWRAYLRDLWPRTDTLVVMVTHPVSYGTFVRRALRIRRPRRELFDHEATRPRRLVPELEALGVILARAYVDCPWWPDLFVSAGETLAGSLGVGKSAPRFVYDPDSYPYAGPLPRDLARALRRHPSFEESRLAPMFAHHRAYLVVRPTPTLDSVPSPTQPKLAATAAKKPA